MMSKRFYYEPKCRICKSEFRDLADKLKEQDWKLQDIKDYLKNNFNEDISIFSLSRHYSRHSKTQILEDELKIPEGEIIVRDIGETLFSIYRFMMFGSNGLNSEKINIEIWKSDVVVRFAQLIEKEFKESSNNSKIFFTDRDVYELCTKVLKEHYPEKLDDFNLIYQKMFPNCVCINSK